MRRITTTRIVSVSVTQPIITLCVLWSLFRKMKPLLTHSISIEISSSNSFSLPHYPCTIQKKIHSVATLLTHHKAVLYIVQSAPSYIKINTPFRVFITSALDYH